MADAADPTDDPEDRDAPPPFTSRVVTWGRTSAMGAVLTGAGLGLREVLDPPREDEIVIVVDADGEPEDLPVRLELDPDDPAASRAFVREEPTPPVA